MDRFQDIKRNKLPDVYDAAAVPFHVGELKPIHSLSWNQRAAIIPAKEYNKLDFADVLQKTLTVWFCGELALDHRADPLYCELAYAEDDKGDWKRACKAF
jgi:hypothetical protein